MKFERRLKERKVKIGIIGLGYVGLPLAIKFLASGFEVVGVDYDKKRIEQLSLGKSYINDVESAVLKKAVSSGRFHLSDDYSALKGVDVFSICVPTPLDKNKQPDLSYVEYATNKIAKILRKGQLVVLESTTYPGTTEEILLPAFTKSKMKVGRDFYLAFSPERVDPGNKKFALDDIPKVVGGVTPACTKRAVLIYSQTFKTVFPVSSPKVAEMEKLLENIFRSVNIALVNELAILCCKMGIDIREVIAAAKTKPYGFMAFYPGPGIGGHCIPLDPFYLSWKSKEYGAPTRFIELAGEVNDAMPDYVVSRVQGGLNSKSKSLKNSKILVLGIAYKKDINDVRESPALKIMSLLENMEAKVFFNDPFVDGFEHDFKAVRVKKMTAEFLKKVDCVLIVTDHSVYDYSFISKYADLIVDTRGVVKKATNPKCKVIGL